MTGITRHEVQRDERIVQHLSDISSSVDDVADQLKALNKSADTLVEIFEKIGDALRGIERAANR